MFRLSRSIHEPSRLMLNYKLGWNSNQLNQRNFPNLIKITVIKCVLLLFIIEIEIDLIRHGIIIIILYQTCVTFWYISSTTSVLCHISNGLLFLVTTSLVVWKYEILKILCCCDDRDILCDINNPYFAFFIRLRRWF